MQDRLAEHGDEVGFGEGLGHGGSVAGRGRAGGSFLSGDEMGVAVNIVSVRYMLVLWTDAHKLAGHPTELMWADESRSRERAQPSSGPKGRGARSAAE